MKISLNVDGDLYVKPETEIEEYAIKQLVDNILDDQVSPDITFEVPYGPGASTIRTLKVCKK